MKKLFRILFLMVLLLMTLIACGEGDFVGRWGNFPEEVITFYSDGTGISQTHFHGQTYSLYEFHWRISGRSLYLDFGEGEQAHTRPVVRGNVLIWRGEEYTRLRDISPWAGDVICGRFVRARTIDIGGLGAGTARYIFCCDGNVEYWIYGNLIFTGTYWITRNIITLDNGNELRVLPCGDRISHPFARYDRASD